MKMPDLLRFPDSESLVQAVSLRWLTAMNADIVASGVHHVALPGGRVAGRLMAATAQSTSEPKMVWSKVLFFWGDERCVPPDDRESNYRLAVENLLGPKGIGIAQCHRLQGELDPEESARKASEMLRRSLPQTPEGMPILDLILLGMGEDGHVASLFPEAPSAVVESREPVVAVVGPKPPPRRLTLSFGVLAAARNVWVLASGAGKEEALRCSLSSGLQTPLGRLLALRQRTQIFTDLA